MIFPLLPSCLGIAGHLLDLSSFPQPLVADDERIAVVVRWRTYLIPFLLGFVVSALNAGLPSFVGPSLETK